VIGEICIAAINGAGRCTTGLVFRRNEKCKSGRDFHQAGYALPANFKGMMVVGEGPPGEILSFEMVFFS